MTSSSPERRGGLAGDVVPGADPARDVVLRGDLARGAAAVRFDVNLRTSAPVPSELVEQARAQARTTGYAEGWAQGQRAARIAAQAVADQAAAEQRAAVAAGEAALARAVAAVDRAAADLAQRQLAAVAQAHEALLAAAVTVAEALLGAELSTGEDRGLAAVRRALAAAPERGEVTVRLHPADHHALTGPDAGAYEVDGRPVTLRPDPALAPGDAVAECGVVTVDATLAAAVARVREVLAR
ncbi:MAG TPA: FliH/SctL family protein [Pilimelia sp.]|nr:FliH/SctL family protein [Pilimelia sp.]